MATNIAIYLDDVALIVDAPVDCIGSFVDVPNSCIADVGQAMCGNVNGHLTANYTISTPASLGGLACPHNANDVLVSACTLTQPPCPSVNCVGSYVENKQSCSLDLSRNIFTVSANGATSCPGPYTVNGTDNGVCFGGNNDDGTGYHFCLYCRAEPAHCRFHAQLGVLAFVFERGPSAPRTRAIDSTTPSATRRATLTNRSAEGFFVTCTPKPSCGPVAGFTDAVYKITTAATYGGANCPVQNGTVMLRGGGSACTFTQPPCPVNCVGAYVDVPNSCAADAGQATCGGNVNGHLSASYTISTPAAFGGLACPYNTGNLLVGGGSACPFTQSPCPVNCVGSYVEVAGSCSPNAGSASCGTVHGLTNSMYVITTPAAYGGQDCSVAHGALSVQGDGSVCLLTQSPCPVDCRWCVRGRAEFVQGGCSSELRRKCEWTSRCDLHGQHSCCLRWFGLFLYR